MALGFCEGGGGVFIEWRLFPALHLCMYLHINAQEHTHIHLHRSTHVYYCECLLHTLKPLYSQKTYTTYKCKTHTLTVHTAHTLIQMQTHTNLQIYTQSHVNAHHYNLSHTHILLFQNHTCTLFPSSSHRTRTIC